MSSLDGAFRQLQQRVGNELEDQLLGSMSAGPLDLFGRIMLLVAFSNQVRDAPSAWQVLEADAVRVLEGVPMKPSFFGGLSGLMFASEYARARCNRFIEVSNALREVRAELVEFALSSDTENGDLISGAAGIAASLTFVGEMTSDEARRLARRIAGFACRQDGEFGWRLDELGRKEESGQDLGIAHGVPGLMLAAGLLRRFSENCCEFSELEAFVHHGLDWLVDLGDGLRGDSTFGYVSGTSQRSRLAWCYGDLSVGYALLKLGTEIKHARAIRCGEAALKRSLSRTVDNSLVKDQFICHGSAGILMMFSELFRYAPHLANASRLRIWEDQVQSEISEVLSDASPLKLDYLEGWGGVCLLGMELLGEIDAAWRRPLLII